MRAKLTARDSIGAFLGVSPQTPLVLLRSGFRMPSLLVELAMRAIGRNLIQIFPALYHKCA
jgi:hypothetical protein